MDLLPLLAFQCLNGVVSGLIFALVVLGLSLTFGLMNLMNVAHSAFYMLGAMVSASLATALGLGFLPSVAIAVVLVTLLGALLNACVLEKLIGREPLIGLLATAGLLLVIDGLALAGFGSAPIIVDDPLDASIDILGIDYPIYRLLAALVSLVAIGALFGFLRTTRMGLWMRAVPQSPELALIAGVSPRRVNQTTVVLGSFLAALAGGVITPISGAQYEMGLAVLGTAFIVVVVGGARNLAGAVLVSIAIGVIRGIAASFVAPTAAEVLSLLVLLPFLLICPNGILGGRRA